MVRTVDNKAFMNPTVGADLTVKFMKQSTDIDTDTTKYMDLPCAKKIQIRSNKIFKVIKINGTTLSDPSPSSSTAPEWKIDVSGTGALIESVTFQPEEASGEFNVLGVGGVY